MLLACLLATLAFVAYSVLTRERTLRDGELVLLRLVPVDPRSLLQGDYMRLRYAIEQDADPTPRRGYLVLSVDENRVGHYVRLQAERDPLKSGEHLLRFGRRGAGAGEVGRLSVGAESYFFQEGEGDKYARAKYCGLRLDGKGGSVLVGLWDEDLERIR